MALGRLRQPARVIEGGVDVVHAAGPDDDHQPVVVPAQHPDHFLAPADYRLLALVAERQLIEQRGRRRQLDDFPDPLVADAVPASLLGPDHHLVLTVLQSIENPTSEPRAAPRGRARGSPDTVCGARPKRDM